jgi:hypothetical protein
MHYSARYFLLFFVKPIEYLNFMKYLYILLILVTSSISSLESFLLHDDIRLDRSSGSLNAQLIRVFADSAGSYSVFWQELMSNGYTYFKGRRFARSGSPIGTEKVLGKLPSTSLKPCEFAGSGYGNYVLIKTDSIAGWNFQRFNSDLTPFDPLPVKIGLLSADTVYAAIDVDYQLIFILQPKLTEDTSIIYYYNRTGLADSIINRGSYYWPGGYAKPISIAMHGRKRATIMYESRRRYTNYTDITSIQSRTFSYDNNEILWISDFSNHFQVEDFTFGISVEGSSGRKDHPNAICLFADRRETPSYYSIYKNMIDSNGNVFGTPIVNNWAAQWATIGTGFGGKHSVVFRTYNDSLWHMFYSPYPVGMPSFVGKGTCANVSSDYYGEVLLAIERGSSVFLSKIGSDSIKNIRINNMESDPILTSTVMVNKNYGVDLYAAFKDRNMDSVVLTSLPDSIEMRDAVPAFGGNGYPELSANRSKLAMAMIKPESSTDTSIILHLWDHLNKTKVTTRTASDNGVKASNPCVAVSTNRIAVVWEDRRVSRGDTTYVYLQVFDTLGNSVGGNIPVSPGIRPRIALAASNRFVVSFAYKTDMISYVGGIPIIKTISNTYACVINGNGTFHVPVSRINEQQNIANNPAVCAANANGNTLHTWLQGSSLGTTSKLYGRLMGSNGGLTGAVVQFAEEDSAISDYSVSQINDSISVIAWHDRNSNNVKYSLFNPRGMSISTSVIVNNQRINSDIPLSISASGCDMSLAVSWLNGRYYDRTKHMMIGDIIKLKNTAVIAESNMQKTEHSKKITVFPNPFNPNVKINVNCEHDNIPLSLKILDIRGVLVKDISFLGNYTKSRRLYTVNWDGMDQQNQKAASGVYFISYGNKSTSNCTAIHLLR